MKRLLACIAFVLMAFPALAESLPNFPKGTGYASARGSLIALGYKPVKMPDADECFGNDERCKGRPEMTSCSGTGLGYCLFTWRSPGDALIEIVTQGEGDPTVASVKCRANCNHLERPTRRR